MLVESFLLELFKSLFRKREVLDICSKHLQYHYLPGEYFKSIWKVAKSYYSASGDKIPTIGLVAQTHKNNPKILSLLEKINQTEIVETETILHQLEQFIKDSLSMEAYKNFSIFYNKGEHEKARSLFVEAGEILSSFSLKKETIYYERIFGDYDKRKTDRIIKRSSGEALERKIPFSIDCIDAVSRGGCNKQDTFLFLAQSGVGKTKLLRWIGVGAARRGFKVLHIQAEGSKQECLDGYDATWTGQLLYEIESGQVSEDLEKKLKKIKKEIGFTGGEIYTYAPEQFNSMSMKDVRDHIIEIEKIYGKIDMVLLDYFELVDPGDGKKYHVSEERQRREAIASKMKNIAVEFDVVFGSCTQASTVSPEELNNPDFVQTRYHISEFKGAIKPFSYFITLNQTDDEYENGIMRLFLDKIRKYKGRQTYTIFQNYEYDKFYDRQRTLNYYNKNKEEEDGGESRQTA